MCCEGDGTLARVLFPGWGSGEQVAEVPVSPAPERGLTCLLPQAQSGARPCGPRWKSLLAASSHVLKEVLDGPFVDPLKNLRLPRRLNPNKKYSWMQKKRTRRVVRPGCGLGEQARGRTGVWHQRGC